jgi:hypothetical protein
MLEALQSVMLHLIVSYNRTRTLRFQLGFDDLPYLRICPSGCFSTLHFTQVKVRQNYSTGTYFWA